MGDLRTGRRGFLTVGALAGAGMSLTEFSHVRQAQARAEQKDYVYHNLECALIRYGHSVEVAGSGSMRVGVGYSEPPPSKPSSCWVAERMGTWYVGINWRVFRMRHEAAAISFCLTALQRSPTPATDALHPGDRGEEISSLEWHRIDVQFRDQMLPAGWRKMSDSACDTAWNTFEATEELRASSKSYAWSCSAFFELPESQQYDVELTVCQVVVDALRLNTRAGEELWALEWHHPSYFVDPHRVDTAVDLGWWPVALLPRRDSSIFMSPDMRFGLLTSIETVNHVVAVDRIVAFGQPFVDVLIEKLPEVFSVDRSWSAL